MTFQWQRPRVIGLDADTVGKVRAYAAEHSLPGEPYDGPGPEVRANVLAITKTLPQLPACELDEDEPDIDCLTCDDSGEIHVGEWGFPMLCPDCPRGDWTWRHELNDDMRMED